MKLKFTKEGVDFIQSFCAWHNGDEIHYFIPHVFEATDKEDVFRVISIEKAPVHVRESIHQQYLKLDNCPGTPKELLLKENLKGKFN